MTPCWMDVGARNNDHHIQSFFPVLMFLLFLTVLCFFVKATHLLQIKLLCHFSTNVGFLASIPSLLIF